MSTSSPQPFDEGEGVLVDLNVKRYYQLNETAMFIWQRLEKRVPPREIVADLLETYEVSLEHATASVEQACAAFRSYDLMREV
jgi:hypothetical protein